MVKKNLPSKRSRFYLFLIIPPIILFIIYFSTWGTSSEYQSVKQSQNLILNNMNRYKVKKTKFEGAKVVHFDLKGAPPKISYYKKILPLISKMGATGLLMEYEDMFPYSGPVRNISALNAYTLQDIKMINNLAKNNNLTIIPLVQTFGHLEFVLKLDEFKELREILKFPQVICPTHKKTLITLMQMIDQVVKNHPNSEYIHIGADEVYNLGICDRCSTFMNEFKLTKNMLFLEHVNAITKLIHKKYPYLKILMWDDEFRSFNLKDFQNKPLNDYVIPVVWKYTKDVYEELGPTLWNMYAEVFPKVWVASAFKGATGSNQYVSDVNYYVENHRSWLSVITEHQKQIKFDGIILTGWQRYDHFAVLCELLPVAIPSLAMSLRVILGFKDSPLSPPRKVAHLLGCEQPYALIGSVFGSPKCSYPGGDILENVLKLQQLKQELEGILLDSRIVGWMSSYNIDHKFSNPQHILSIANSLDRIRSELIQIDEDITLALNEVYDNFTVSEWKEIFLKPLEKEITSLWIAKDKILESETWPRRPLLMAYKDEL